MIILDATTKSLEAVLAGAITTSQLPIVASYVDVVAVPPSYTPGETDTQTNSTTGVTVVAAPAASAQRQVKLITVFNADTVPATLTLRYNDNATLRTMLKITLAAGSTLVYTDGEGFRVLDTTGAIIGVGSTGASGPQGQIGVPGRRPEDPERPRMVPGPIGPAGAAGGGATLTVGTWTPIDSSGAGLAFTVTDAKHLRLVLAGIGSIVFVTAYIIYPATADATTALIGGLPFSALAGTSNNAWGGYLSFCDSATLATQARILTTTTTFRIATAQGVALTNAQLSTRSIAVTLVYRDS